ncbi:LysR family transcriptional regulator [Aminicella lysinilytica]|uniref:LysR family transcriptional regulator n=1 Tax=Aminicella lysinilytica TaxID=433323 RepID=UPI0026EE15FE|nr:LysR family transcriptional regulator [Aminicella lysinilytica]
MNTEQIEGFCYLAETLNMSRSAELMFISQPAFSRMIKNLEEELGCQLYERSKINPKLTPTGEQIYRRMTAMNSIYGDIQTLAQLDTDKGIHTVRFGILDNGMDELVRKIIKKFHVEHPEAHLVMKEFSESELCQAVASGLIDIAFLYHYQTAVRMGTEGVKIQGYRDCVVVNNESPLALEKTIRLEDLRDESFVMIRKDKSINGYNHTMALCLDNGFTPIVAYYADSVYTSLIMVEFGMGVMILVDSDPHFGVKDVTFIPIEGVDPCEQWMIWKKDSKNSYIDVIYRLVDSIINE